MVSLYLILFVLHYSPLRSVTEVPFTIYKDKIIINVSINNSTVGSKLLFDTGANTFLKKKSQHTPDTATNTTINLCGTNFKSDKLPTHSFNQDSNFIRLFSELDGIFGYDLMKDYNWKIDSKDQILYFSRSPFSVPENQKIQLTTESDFKPTVSVSTGSIIEPTLIIDTGSSSGVNLDPSFFRMLSNNVEDSMISTGFMKRLSTWDQSYTGEYKIINYNEIMLGEGVIYNTVEVTFMPSVSCVGMGFLKNYTLILNFTNLTAAIF